MNRLGSSRAILRRKRLYRPGRRYAGAGLWARDDEEAEDAFNEYCEAVQYHHPRAGAHPAQYP